MSDLDNDERRASAPADGTPAGRYVRSDRGKQKKSRSLRLVVLGLGLAIITGIGLMHQLTGIPVVGVDALCPFGGIETILTLISTGGYVKQIAASSLILLGVVLVTAVIFRRSFCGYICPLGALQEFFGGIGKAIWPKGRPQVPTAIDKPARYLKYVVLAVFTVWTWQAAELVIRPYDPWVAFMHITSAEVLSSFGIGLAVLAISLAGSVVYDRFFCKYLCPMGGFLGLISRLSLFKVRREATTCIDCKACDKACPMNITVSEVETVVSAECINCNACVDACPVKDTLRVATKGATGKRTVLTPSRVLASMVLIIAILVGATTAAGAFAWTLPTLAQAAQTNGGTFNLDAIRGSMSLEEVSKATGIPPKVFEDKWKIAPADMSKPMKDIAEHYGFDVHTGVRTFVQEQLKALGK